MKRAFYAALVSGRLVGRPTRAPETCRLASQPVAILETYTTAPNIAVPTEASGFFKGVLGTRFGPVSLGQPRNKTTYRDIETIVASDPITDTCCCPCDDS